jgi:5S rRNA maturation endonuclease (ribonuclease M5)
VTAARSYRPGRDDELEHFKRDVNLTELAASLGYRLVDRERSADGKRRGSTQASVSMCHAGTDDKIVIRRDADAHWIYFSVRDDRDNGTVVDFLQRRRGQSLGDVRKELRSWLRVDRPRVPARLYRPTLGKQTRDSAAAKTSYAVAAPSRESLYLERRGIRPATFRDDRFAATFRVDARGNVLFGHVDPVDPTQVVGYEIKNSGFTSFASGGQKTFWSSAVRRDDHRIVVVEGSIDALSYHQLFPRPRTRYLSTGGAVGPEQLELIGRAIAAMPPGSDIVVATDNDEAGDKLAGQIAEATGRIPTRRHRPPIGRGTGKGKDWNDVLQLIERRRLHRREYRLER